MFELSSHARVKSRCSFISSSVSRNSVLVTHRGNRPSKYSFFMRKNNLSVYPDLFFTIREKKSVQLAKSWKVLDTFSFYICVSYYSKIVILFWLYLLVVPNMFSDHSNFLVSFSLWRIKYNEVYWCEEKYSEELSHTHIHER